MLNNLATILDAGVPVSLTSYESIATVTVGSGGSSAIDFTSIPTTYKHLQIRAISKTNRADNNDAMQIQVGNGSVDTAANYNNHNLYGDGSGANAGATDTPGSGLLVWLIAGNNSSNAWAGTVTDLLDYSDTNKYKTARTLLGYDNNGNGIVGLSSGAWRSTSAINTIKIKPRYGTSFNQYSHFALYGIKG
jgi:hypothetical protein